MTHSHPSSIPGAQPQNGSAPGGESRSAHGHGWLVGVAGVAIAVVLLAVLPTFPAIAGSLVLLVLFHLIGFAVMAGAIYGWFSRAIGRFVQRRFRSSRQRQGVDFGWSLGMDWGLWITTLALLAIALGCNLQYPHWWPAWLLLVLQGMTFGVGGILMRQSRRTDIAILPMVPVLSGPTDHILDAGCGAGRTSLAIAKVMGAGRITALDRFDAYYIDGGGQDLLRSNLQLAGIAERVEIVAGDLTRMPFPQAHFESIISTNAIDHLGRDIPLGLAELQRVLKPGGRMLMVLWVPGWFTFAIASVASLALTTPKEWRRLLSGVGFAVEESGYVNGMWYVVARKPDQRSCHRPQA